MNPKQSEENPYIKKRDTTDFPCSAQFEQKQVIKTLYIASVRPSF